MEEKNLLFLPILEKEKPRELHLAQLGTESRKIILLLGSHIEQEQNVQLEGTNQRQVIGLVRSGD